jgi:streptogramin lyase
MTMSRRFTQNVSITCLAVASLAVALPAGADELIGMPAQWMQNNSLWTMERPEGDFVAGVAVHLPGHVVYGCYALATHPTTGEVWALLGDRSNARLLCKIDPATGEATLIGTTSGASRRFATLAFNDDGGILYGATGQGGVNQNTLFSLSPDISSDHREKRIEKASFAL